MPRRLRILTWHVHGNYLYNLSHVPHDFFLVTDAARLPGHVGRVGALPWGPNVHEAPLERLATMPFDVVLYQHRAAWDEDRPRWLSPGQRSLPRIYLEHDPPLAHPTGTRHWVSDGGTLLVHCTHYNALMWDSGPTPTRVIEHGVQPLSDDRYRGDLASGLVVVNHLHRRGRRLGSDLYDQLAADVPLTLAGMGTEADGRGIGEVPQPKLPALMAAHRFFFHPARYTSLGLALIEAMHVGQPVVGLATTELASVIHSGVDGFIDNRPPVLAETMKRLLREPGLAAEWGARGRELARQRFGIDRFVADWMQAFHEVAA
ncbi:MAG: glycosyltransferase family 4 protein [Burkholderiaceae bacterium]